MRPSVKVIVDIYKIVITRIISTFDLDPKQVWEKNIRTNLTPNILWDEIIYIHCVCTWI